MTTANYSILVIDDEESIRRLLAKELASAGREIHTAADGAEDLSAGQHNHLPGMTGRRAVALDDVRQRERGVFSFETGGFGKNVH